MRHVKKSVIRNTLRIISLCIIIYFCVTLTSYIVRIETLDQKEKTLNTNLIELKSAEEQLKTEILKLNDKEYIARYAREHYLYTKDGEYVIKIDEKDEKTKESEEEKQNWYFYAALALSLTTLSIIFINNKNKRKKLKLKKKTNTR